MKFDIRIHEGAGPVRFGMTRDEVRASVRLEFKDFRRSLKARDISDFFPSVPMFVYYSSEGTANAIEFAKPAQPSLRGRDLLAMTFLDLVSELKKEDSELVTVADGFTSRKLGIGAYAPEAADNPRQPPEGIIVFAPGYYDS